MTNFDEIRDLISSDLERLQKIIKQSLSSNSPLLNKIVENISQLSAVTQEVTVNAEQVHNMSEQNLEYAKQVKEAVGNIRITSEKMEIEE